MSRVRRVALVTHGLHHRGGISAVTEWLRTGLESLGGYTVDVHDLATSSRDAISRRLVVPSSWTRRTLRQACASQPPHYHWGANAVELEVMRYRPRWELTAALAGYDLVQVVAGGPAWASAVVGTGVPVVLQVATRAAWERDSQLVTQPLPLRAWRTGMTGLTSAVERSAIRRVDAILVENAAMLECARALGQSRVVKAPPGVDTTVFAPPATGWRREGHLLSVCRLGDPRKGLERTVHAYGHLVRRRQSIPKLVLAGSGTLYRPVAALIGQLGLGSHVEVRSDVRREELVSLYRGASVFLQTSFEEGLGLTILEAMACGLPVVATETAGSRETVVDGFTGWLVPQSPAVDVPAAVADRVADILADPGCPFSQRGRARCLSHFATDVALRRFTDAYDAVLGCRLESTIHSGYPFAKERHDASDVA